MENISKVEALSKRDVYYYRRRFVNRVFSALANFFAEEAKVHGATKSKIAKRLGVDPSQITRWLAHPNNLTLESISDILLALDAEAEPPNIVPFRERLDPNYAHPLLAHVLHLPGSNKVLMKPAAPSAGNGMSLQIKTQSKVGLLSVNSSMAAAE